MAIQQTAKQHVVPKFYLRRFTDAEGNFEVFDKQWGKFTGAKNPSSFGHDLYFYAQTTGQADDLSQDYEEILQSFENHIAPKYDPICEKILDNKHLTEEDEFILALHASTMWLRGYNMRQQVGEANSALMKNYSQLLAYAPKARERIKEAILHQEGREMTDEEADNTIEFMKKGEYTVHGDNLTHLSMIGDYLGYANLFCAKKIRIYIAEGQRRFITSDVPIIELSPKYARPQSPYGPSFIEQLHSIPLSSQILLEFHDPDILAGKKLTRKRISDDDVLAANARQLDGARRWCAGVTKDDFCTRKSIPGALLPPVKRTGKFEENRLGVRVS